MRGKKFAPETMRSGRKAPAIFRSAALLVLAFAAAARADFIVEPGATVTVTNNAVLDSTGSIVINGVLDASGSPAGRLRLSKNWNKAESGIFVAGTSTVTFYDRGASSITGNTSFYVFSCVEPGKTLFFQNGSTQDVANLLALTGTAGNEIILRPSIAGAAWYIRLTSPQTADFVAVENSSAMVQTVRARSSIDSGGNNGFWIFDEIGVLILGATDYDFGLLRLSSAAITSSSFTIRNVGNVLHDYSIRAATLTPSSPWSLSTSSGTDRMILWGGFNPAKPGFSDFGAEDIILNGDQTATGTKFAIGASSGTGVPASDDRYLWLKVDMPLLTSTTLQQLIQVSITGSKSP